MRITDTTNDMFSSYESGSFDMAKWEEYIDNAVPGASVKCTSDMQECLNEGFSWEKDYLPVLKAVLVEEQKRNNAIESFHAVTDGLNDRILEKFEKTVDTNIVLYLGLCNGAGWVTEVNNESTVLLGIEKIIELDWCDIDSMNGLILHELGHVYQDQHGVLHRQFDNMLDKFIWQLFTEGIAMVFEQEIVGDPDYFHQYDAGWNQWCHENFEYIKKSFCDDLPTMTNENQRYFGDWVSFDGYGDTGYYLGAHFVRYILQKDSFDNLINYDIQQVKEQMSLFGRK